MPAAKGGRPAPRLGMRWLALVIAVTSGLLGLAEIAARVARPSLAQADMSLGFAPPSPFLTQHSDREHRVWVRTTDAVDLFTTRPMFHPQEFPVERTTGETRVFVVGGSTVYGWPYSDSRSVSRLLEVGLRATNTTTQWNIINLGSPGFGSERMRRVVAEMPIAPGDLVVVLETHNEGFEHAMRAAIGSETSSWRFALLQRSALLKWAVLFRAKNSHPASLNIAALWGRLTALHPEDLERDFGHNLTSIAQTLQSRGARVYFAAPASNTSDLAPFERLEDSGVQKEIERVRAELTGDDIDAALNSMDEALRAAPNSAHLVYLKGRILAMKGLWAVAALNFRRARDLDRLRLRGTTGLKEVMQKVAQAHNVVFIDLEAFLESEGATPLIGDTFFLDLSHPNERGANAYAQAIARSILENSGSSLDPEWGDHFSQALEHYRATLPKLTEEDLYANDVLLGFYTRFSPNPEKARLLMEQKSKL